MKTEREKMLSGELYDCADPELLVRWHYAKELTQRYNCHISTADRESQLDILDKLLGGHGQNVSIAPPFHVDYGENIYIGNDCEVNMNCLFLDCNRITIGNNCGIAPSVQIYTAFHPVEPTLRLAKDSSFWLTQTAPVTIGNNVWIGGGAIILPGVTIGDNVSIGAGSVVTRSIPANCVAVGNPCRVIRQL